MTTIAETKSFKRICNINSHKPDELAQIIVSYIEDKQGWKFTRLEVEGYDKYADPPTLGYIFNEEGWSLEVLFHIVAGHFDSYEFGLFKGLQLIWVEENEEEEDYGEEHYFIDYKEENKRFTKKLT